MQNQSYIPDLFATRWQSDFKSFCSFTCLLRRSRRLCGIKSWWFLDKPKSRTLFMWASDKVFSRKEFGLLASCVAFSQHYALLFHCAVNAQLTTGPQERLGGTGRAVPFTSVWFVPSPHTNIYSSDFDALHNTELTDTAIVEILIIS